MLVKICGISRDEDIEYINKYKPDYIGFVFAESKRKISAEQAKNLHDKLDEEIKTVGVFVNESIKNVVDTMQTANIDVIQLHGDEDADYIENLRDALPEDEYIEIWKAVRVNSVESILTADKLDIDMMILDSFSNLAYGGTGEISSWDIIAETLEDNDIETPYMLAGGLNAENLMDAIDYLMPFSVDISSGAETDGVKDERKIHEIMNILKRC